ncbi:MAG: hypothetical protein ACLP4V_11785 [Methylocella sp.]
MDKAERAHQAKARIPVPLYDPAIELLKQIHVGAIQFLDPEVDDKKRATLLEVRCGGGGKGAQTVFPGSVHPSGEAIQWHASFFQIGVRVAPKLSLSDPSDPALDATYKQFAGKPLAMTKVSMSWWLSAAVQSYLDVRLCDNKNRSSLKDLMDRLSQRVGG